MKKRSLVTARSGIAVAAAIVLLVVGAAAAIVDLPSLAAGGLLFPARRHVTQGPPAGCQDVTFQGVGVTLRGWRCAAVGETRATVVFLHGVGDNRTAAAGIVPRFVPRGFEVVAYDSRAHGESGGNACTYGYREKDDLRSVIDALGARRVVLLGTSLGAAVALQEAATDSRVAGVVAAETFSDLRTVARQRAPWFLTEGFIRRAFAIAEQRGRFRVDAVSPVDAARRIHVPVLLVHGASDRDTPPDHSRRVFAALAGPKELLLVPGAAHNQSLGDERVWEKISRWIDGLRFDADRLVLDSAALVSSSASQVCAEQ